MAKERHIIRIKKFARLALAGVVLGVVTRAVDASHQDLSYEGSQTPIPNYPTQKSSDLIPSLGILDSNELSKTWQEEVLQKYALELPGIIARVEANPGIFNVGQDIEDLKIYYLIYRAAQDKTGVDWYLLWIMHQEESTVSSDPNAFVLDADGQYGCMQRSTFWHHDEDVVRASAGYEFLANLAQRHFDDWREIIWAAEAVREYSKQEGSLLGGLLRYSADGPAQRRYQRYLLLQGIFT